MSDILEKIVASKREEIAAMQKAEPLEQVREAAGQAAPVLDFAGALRRAKPKESAGALRRAKPKESAGALRGARQSGARQSGAEKPGGAGALRGGDKVNIIAEIKRRSPSKGEFAWHGDVARQVRAYQAGGASAISVLTDERFFGGTPQLLREIKGISRLPVMQKEFVLEPYQIYFARALGADAVLLIARILPGELLAELAGLAREVGLATLVEVVNEAELERATAAGAEVIGVNNRDLATFRTDLAHTLRLLPHFGDDQIAITESGIHSRADVERLLDAGVDGFLIGEALMVAPDAAAYLRVLRGEEQAEAAS